MASGFSWRIRPATRDDVPSILWLSQLLSEYENEPHSLKIGEKEYLRDGFGDRPYFHVLVAESTSDNGLKSIDATDPAKPSSSMPHNERIVGYALYFYTYSTCEGKCLYLEDLYVREECRNQGIGTDLMQACAKVACDEGCARMIWQVLDWNTRATELYQRLGGKVLKELLTLRMTQPELGRFASGQTTTKNTT